jgi:hypothetical protein
MSTLKSTDYLIVAASSAVGGVGAAIAATSYNKKKFGTTQDTKNSSGLKDKLKTTVVNLKSHFPRKSSVILQKTVSGEELARLRDPHRERETDPYTAEERAAALAELARDRRTEGEENDAQYIETLQRRVVANMTREDSHEKQDVVNA